MPALKSALSSMWFVRVDGEADVLRPKVTRFAEKIDCVSLLCVAHTGSKKENPHIHFLMVLNTTLQKQSFSVRVKKEFEVVDRGYAVDVWDGNRGEGAASYVFHETDADILCSKGWTNDEIKEAQRVGNVVAAAVKQSMDKASQKLVERALQHFKERPRPSKYDIISYMVDEIHQGRSHDPGFKWKQFVQEIEIRLTPANQLDNLKNQLYHDLFRV